MQSIGMVLRHLFNSTRSVKRLTKIIFCFPLHRILEHGEDPDIDDPIPAEGLKVTHSNRSPAISEFDIQAIADAFVSASAVRLLSFAHTLTLL